jgi:hypothetical protein
MERAGRMRKPRSRTEREVSNALSSNPQPLETSTRATMEARFNHSFGDVQVHSEAQSANALGARAFAVDDQIAFSPGQYAPGTPQGDHLIAHELAHVVQSRNVGESDNHTMGLLVAEPDSDSEGEAHAAADAVMSGSVAPALSTSTTGMVSRSIWDWIPGMGGLSDSQTTTLREAPGEGVHGGPYIYGNQDGASGLNGVNYGYGRGHAAGSTGWNDVFGTGDRLNASGSYDSERVDGHFGAWSTPRQDGSTDTNVGFQLGGKSASVQGELAYTGANGQGAYLQGDAAGPSFDVSSYAGTGGFGLGAQASVGGFNVGGGTRGTETDEYNKIGLSEGVGAAVRGNWGDTDGDGFREYGGGIDIGPLSLDMRSEDPLRMAAKNLLPGGGLYADWLLGEGNSTEGLANEFGLTTRNADLSTTYDVVSDAVGGLVDSAGSGIEDLGSAASGIASEAGSVAEGAWNSLTDWDW